MLIKLRGPLYNTVDKGHWDGSSQTSKHGAIAMMTETCWITPCAPCKKVQLSDPKPRTADQ